MTRTIPTLITALALVVAGCGSDSGGGGSSGGGSYSPPSTVGQGPASIDADEAHEAARSAAIDLYLSLGANEYAVDSCDPAGDGWTCSVSLSYGSATAGDLRSCSVTVDVARDESGEAVGTPGDTSSCG